MFKKQVTMTLDEFKKLESKAEKWDNAQSDLELAAAVRELKNKSDLNIIFFTYFDGPFESDRKEILSTDELVKWYREQKGGTND